MTPDPELSSLRGDDPRVATRVPDWIVARRSVRAFTDAPVTAAQLDALVEAAVHAPAPHHSRPWRFATVRTAAAKTALADAMGAAWRADLEADHVPAARIDELLTASRQKVERAPALLLACLTWDGLDRYPDERRRRAEGGMALLSLGAALENVMLTAAATGLATGWFAAPIFAPDAARDALGLPGDWIPQALLFVGHPDPGYAGRPRPPVDLDELRVER